jgi:PiT family inorganic phosphate transporter
VDPLIFVIVVFAITVLFEFGNGFNDAANSIATIVSTRVLTPRQAVAWAAFWNFVAAFAFGTAVAKTIGTGLVHLEQVNEAVLIGGLIGAILWTYMCTFLGLPISVSHSLMGGFGGAAVAHAGFKAIIVKGWVPPVIFIFVAPFIGMIVAAVVTVVTSWIVRKEPPRRVDQWFRRLQLVSAAGYSLGHGTNDAQKGMGIITVALVASGIQKDYEVPFWVIISCHAAIALGTLSGGWRVVRTMGQRITKLSPFGGFAAETAGAVTLFGTAQAGIPVSTTHTITGSIIGVGVARRLTAVRWGVTRRIGWAWVLTIPGSAVLGAALYFALSLWLR